jgi:Calcineurin-like phosphoesterase
LLAVMLAALLTAMMTRIHLLWVFMPFPTWSSPLNNAENKLAFSKDGSFQITVFNDLHFGEGEDNPPEWGWGPPSDKKTTHVMNTVLDTETADLVVLNGDLITGENTYIHNSTQYLDIIVEPLVKRKQRWASVYGNHDQQFNLSTQELMRREKLWPNLSLTRDMIRNPLAGTSNYYLPVWGNRTDCPSLLLWFFDSRGGSVFQESTKTGGRVGIEGVVHNVVSILIVCELSNRCRQPNGFSRRKKS